MKDKAYYEQKALLYAERYGIIEYEVEENKMTYSEKFYEGNAKYVTYNAELDLDTMREKRSKKK